MKKINWGTGIVIAIILFISFILFFVIKMSTNSAYEYDLVAKDYYKDELEYQQRIDKLNNAKKLSEDISLRRAKDGIYIDFPLNIDPVKITGTIYLYRPSNKVLDLLLPIKISDHSQFIPYETLIDGRWNILIDWSVLNQKYLYQHSLNL